MDMEIRSGNAENVDVASPFMPMSTEVPKRDNAFYEVNPPLRYRSRSVYLWKQLLASFVICIGSFMTGLIFGYSRTSPSMVNSDMNVTMADVYYVHGFVPVAAVGGSLLCGPLIEYAGRRYTMMGIAVFCFIGWILLGAARKLYMVFVGRMFGGICIGVLYLAFPIYLVESIQTEIRGTLGILPKVFEHIGMLLVFAIRDHLDWSQIAYIGSALPIIFMGLMFLIPETPRWYIAKGRPNDARRVLQWFRGPNTNIEIEIQENIQSQNESNSIGGKACCNLFSMEYIHIVGISIGLIIFQQLCGYYTLLNFQGMIFMIADISGENMIFIIGGISIVSTLFAVGLIDRLGRKMLLYISSIIMMVTLVIMGIYFYIKGDILDDPSGFKWLPLITFGIYLLGYFIGFGTLPWLMIGEILPSKIRGTAFCFVSIFQWVYISYMVGTFRNMFESFQLRGMLWFYAMMCFFALVFVRCFVPETCRKSLEQIEQEMTYDTRRLRSINENRLQNE